MSKDPIFSLDFLTVVVGMGLLDPPLDDGLHVGFDVFHPLLDTGPLPTDLDLLKLHLFPFTRDHASDIRDGAPTVL